MEKRKRGRFLRIFLPILGLALVLSALGLYRYYGQVPKTLKEYYSRLYPNQRYAEDIDRIRYDYPHLLEAAKTVLIVIPEGDLTPGAGEGYSQDQNYDGTDLRVKYQAWDPRSYRRVKVLQVIKGDARPGDVVGVWEYCAVTEEEHLLLRYTESDWPMVKGCVYLLFLNGEVSLDDTRDVRTICGANGWFDLTHLGLNDPQYLPVLYAALRDMGLNAEDGPILTPWTDRRFPLAGSTEKAETKSELTLNPDGTVGGLRWGMTAEEVKGALGTEVSALESGTLLLENQRLLGADAYVMFEFGTMGLELSEDRLYEISLRFSNTTDMSALEEKLSAAFGTEPAEEAGYLRWNSARSLGDALEDGRKSAAISLARQQGIKDQNYLQWLSEQWLFTAVLDEIPFSDGQKGLDIFGAAAMWAGALNDMAREVQGATVCFYPEPRSITGTTEADPGKHVYLTRKHRAAIPEIEELKRIIDGIDSWTPGLVSDEDLTWDGHLGLWGEEYENSLYFSYSGNYLFYTVRSMDPETEKMKVERYFATISPEDMAFIQSIKDTKNGFSG